MRNDVTVQPLLLTYVVNLRRRTDRRKRMEETLPKQLRSRFSSDWDGPFDGCSLTAQDIARFGHRVFPWKIASENPWWSRPLKLGEVGCSLAHLACWEDAEATGSEPYTLVLEDDAVLGEDFLARLQEGLRRLEAAELPFDLLYLGRVPLRPDTPSRVDGFVVPGYSHCTYSYVLSRSGLKHVLASRLGDAVIPVDEFLPALYTDHERIDVRARFPRCLNALAFEPPLVTQLPKDEAGSDTEESPFLGEEAATWSAPRDT